MSGRYAQIMAQTPGPLQQSLQDLMLSQQQLQTAQQGRMRYGRGILGLVTGLIANRQRQKAIGAAQDQFNQNMAAFQQQKAAYDQQQMAQRVEQFSAMFPGMEPQQAQAFAAHPELFKEYAKERWDDEKTALQAELDSVNDMRKRLREDPNDIDAQNYIADYTMRTAKNPAIKTYSPGSKALAQAGAKAYTTAMTSRDSAHQVIASVNQLQTVLESARQAGTDPQRWSALIAEGANWIPEGLRPDQLANFAATGDIYEKLVSPIRQKLLAQMRGLGNLNMPEVDAALGQLPSYSDNPEAVQAGLGQLKAASQLAINAAGDLETYIQQNPEQFGEWGLVHWDRTPAYQQYHQTMGQVAQDAAAAVGGGDGPQDDGTVILDGVRYRRTANGWETAN